MMSSIRSIFVFISTFMEALTNLAEALNLLTLSAKDQAGIYRDETLLENKRKLAQLQLDTEALPEHLKALKAKAPKAT